MIAPVFFITALHLTLWRAIIHHGPDSSLPLAKAYAIIFLCLDIVAFIFQLVGGAVAVSAGTVVISTITSTNIMIAGLSFQLISLTAFALLYTDICWRMKHNRVRVTTTKWALWETIGPSPNIKRYKLFLSSTPLPPSLLNTLLINV
jgi:RTA1 like protein